MPLGRRACHCRLISLIREGSTTLHVARMSDHFVRTSATHEHETTLSMRHAHPHNHDSLRVRAERRQMALIHYMTCEVTSSHTCLCVSYISLQPGVSCPSTFLVSRDPLLGGPVVEVGGGK